jgi:hypothetical protein
MHSIHVSALRTALPLLGCAALFLCSCQARVSGVVRQDASGSLSIRAELETAAAGLIRSLGAFGGKNAGDPVLDSRAISRSLGAAPGIGEVSLKNTGSHAIEGTVAVTNAGDVFASGSGNRFVIYEASASGGRLAVRLDRESGPGVIRLVSQEAADYCSVLMAPLATGETLSKTEYLALVASVYGKALADEIRRSQISAVLGVPGPVKSVAGGTFSGREARFQIPLLNILVLESPLEYEIVW